MADYDEFALPEDDGTDAGPAMKELRAKLAKAHKALQEKDAELAKAQAETRAAKIADVLKAREIPEKFHKLAKRELTDTDLSDEAVNAFIAEYGDLWDAGSSDEELPPEEIEKRSLVDRLNRASARADDPKGFNPGIDDKELRGMSAADLNKFLGNLGNLR